MRCFNRNGGVLLKAGMLVCGIVVSGVASAQTKIVDVTLFPQETNMWCWAASGQMVMDYLGKNVPQCTQANNRFGYTDCCNDPVPSHCVKGGWPEFQKYGFTHDITNDAALSWDQVREQINSSKPIAFSWHWEGGGGHMMVLRGYLATQEERKVAIHNPWPPKVGDSSLITYTAYVSGLGYTHWNDYYNITRLAEKAVIVDVRSLRSIWDSTRQIATEAHAKARKEAEAPGVRAGFEAAGISLEGELGDPILVHQVGLDDLRRLDEEAEPAVLVESGVVRVVYPLLKEKDVVSSITLSRTPEKSWVPTSFGGKNKARLFEQARKRLGEAINRPSSPPFGVAVPALNFYAVAVEEEGDLILAPLISYPELGVKEGQVVGAKRLLPKLVEAAKQHDKLPR